MAAVLPRAVGAGPAQAADAHHLLRHCLRYPAPDRQRNNAADAAAMLEALKYLKRRLDAWRTAGLECAAAGAATCCPAGMPLGLFARRLAARLEARPPRAGEPAEALITEVLLGTAGVHPPRSAGALVPAADQGAASPRVS